MAKETSGILKALRAAMEKEGLEAYLIPSEDPHQSELVFEMVYEFYFLQTNGCWR